MAYFVAPVLMAATGDLLIRVRDSHTLLSVKGNVHLTGPVPMDLKTNAVGAIRCRLPVGEYRIEVTAIGHKPMFSKVHVKEVGNPPETFMLSPEKEPLEDKVFKARLRDGYTLVTGTAIDDETGRPIPRVRISMQSAGLRTVTDAKGNYYFSILTPPIVNDRPTGMDAIVAQRAGYKTMIYRNVLLATEVSGETFYMVRGAGTIQENRLHKLLRTADH